MEYLVYLVYPALFAILFAGCKVNKKGEWNDRFMDYSQTKAFQGFLTICIMLHHIGQKMCAEWLTYPKYKGLELFIPLGDLFVSVFFFCSGYGIYLSYKKKPEYLTKLFLKKRVLPLIIGYYASAWIYFIIRLILGESMNSKKIFCYLTGIKLSNPYGWFALVMPIFYLFFYFSFKYSKKPILAISVYIFIYTLLGTFINHNDYLMNGQWWYNSSFMLLPGILVAKYKNLIVTWCKKNYIWKLTGCFIIFLIFYFVKTPVENIFSYYGDERNWSLLKTVACRWICLFHEVGFLGFFTFFLFLIGMKIQIDNHFLNFMGTITFEFYLMHGLVLELFSYQFCDVVSPIIRITNVALMIVVVYVLSVPLALIMKKILRS